MHIGMRLVGSQGILVVTVIGFIAAADTSSSFFIHKIAILIQLKLIFNPFTFFYFYLYLNSHLYLLDDDILKRAYGE